VEISTIFFYLLAAFILTMAVMAVTAQKIFRAAIWLLFALIGIAALYFWMQMEFIAAVQIVVYVGGVVVLIIFSIFLTHQSASSMPKAGNCRKIAALLACFSGLGLAAFTLLQANLKPAERVFEQDVVQIGKQLLHTGNGGFILPFEVVSLLLLAAMIGGIVIAIKDDKTNPSKAGTTGAEL